MILQALLAMVAALLALGVIALPLARFRAVSPLVYGATILLCGGALVLVANHLLVTARPAANLVLPLGIPWLGAHFRLDALAAYFLLVVNLGGVATGVFSLGYARHEPAPGRVVPFYTAFLAGMNLVVLSADAFTFLLSWEFMSLSSWALVMAHHKEQGTAKAGFVYLVMAGFGTLCLLLAFGLLAGRTGQYAFADMRGLPVAPAVASMVLLLVVVGAGSKAGLVHEDYGLVTVQTSTGIGTGRMRAYQERWQWKAGIALKDWRYVVRIPNIDISNLVSKSSAADLIELMIKAIYRLPTMNGIRPVFYMNRTCQQMLDIQRRDDIVSGGGLTWETVDGKKQPSFRGIPIRLVDALTETEAVVS